MRNFNDLCLFFLLSTVGTVICSPINPTKCNVPVELLFPFQLEDLKNCNDEIEAVKYCSEIQQLIANVSDCGLGRLWKMEELRSRLTSDSRNMPINQDEDVCFNFGSLVKNIKYISLDDDSLGIQLSKNSEFCNSFCNKFQKICPMILKLYWVKGVLFTVKNEIDVKDLSIKELQFLPINTPKPTVKTDSKPEQSQTAKPTVAQKPMPEPTEKSILDITKVQNLVNSLDLHSEDAKTPSPLKEIKSDSKTNEKKPTDSAPKQNEKKKETDSENIPNKNKLTQEIPKSKIIETTALRNEENVRPIKQPDENEFKPQSKPSLSGKDNKKNSDLSTISHIKTNNPDISNKNTKTDISDNKNLNKIEDTVDSSVPETKQKLPVKSLENSLSETENGSNQDSDKNDKTEFGSPASDFGEEFAEPSNEYGGDEEPPSDSVIMDKVGEKEQNNSKKQLDGMGSTFPEEEDGHFFAYFLTIVVLCIAGYLVFHNKQKIIALIIEGRHERRRRPNGGGYKRLDSKESGKTSSQVIF